MNKNSTRLWVSSVDKIYSVGKPSVCSPSSRKKEGKDVAGTKVVRGILLAGCIAGGSASNASADAYIDWYYTGTLTENYHNFGACYYSIGSACTGWNYWFWSRAPANVNDTNGNNLAALETSSAIRGDFFGPNDYGEIRASDAGWSGWYLKASVTLWTSSYLNTAASS